MVKHFPAGRGKKVHSVDGVSLTVRRGEVLGLVGESGLRQVHPGPHDPAGGGRHLRSHRLRRPRHHRRQGQGAEGAAPVDAVRLPGPLRGVRPEDEPGHVPGGAAASPRHEGPRRAARADAGDAGPGRAGGGHPGAPPLGVLGRAAAADGDRPRPAAEPEVPDLRRADLGAGRLDPRPDPEPAGRAEGRARPDPGADLPRPAGGALPVRPGRGDVPGPDRRGRPPRRRCSPTPATPTPGSCWPRR